MINTVDPTAAVLLLENSAFWVALHQLEVDCLNGISFTRPEQMQQRELLYNRQQAVRSIPGVLAEIVKSAGLDYDQTCERMHTQ